MRYREIRHGTESVASALLKLYRPDASSEWGLPRYDGAQLSPGTLYLEDISSIPGVLRVEGIEHYQLRMRLLAGTGDFLLTTLPLEASYEEYNREYLGLGSPRLVLARAAGVAPIQVVRSCLNDPAALAQLVRAAREGLLRRLCPYVGTRDAWVLARVLSELSGTPVQVVAPSPNLSQAANRKSFFTELARLALGEDSVPDTIVARGVDALTDSVREMARRCDMLALKMDSHASSTGNLILDVRRVARMSRGAVREAVCLFLGEAAWDGREAVCVVRWHRDVRFSPSVQVWIPPRGEPVVDGVFFQRLTGATRVFAGSMPMTPSCRFYRQLADGSFVLAGVLQRLGFVGRCSFDAVVCADSRLKFVECNGRWGGTSLPMALMKRLFPQGAMYAAGDVHAPELAGARFPALLERCRADLYDARTGRGRCVLYNAGALKARGKYSAISISRVPEPVGRETRETEKLFTQR